MAAAGYIIGAAIAASFKAPPLQETTSSSLQDGGGSSTLLKKTSPEEPSKGNIVSQVRLYNPGLHSKKTDTFPPMPRINREEHLREIEKIYVRAQSQVQTAVRRTLHGRRNLSLPADPSPRFPSKKAAGGSTIAPASASVVPGEGGSIPPMLEPPRVTIVPPHFSSDYSPPTSPDEVKGSPGSPSFTRSMPHTTPGSSSRVGGIRASDVSTRSLPPPIIQLRGTSTPSGYDTSDNKGDPGSPPLPLKSRKMPLTPPGSSSRVSGVKTSDASARRSPSPAFYSPPSSPDEVKGRPGSPPFTRSMPHIPRGSSSRARSLNAGSATAQKPPHRTFIPPTRTTKPPTPKAAQVPPIASPLAPPPPTVAFGVSSSALEWDPQSLPKWDPSLHIISPSKKEPLTPGAGGSSSKVIKARSATAPKSSPSAFIPPTRTTKPFTFNESDNGEDPESPPLRTKSKKEPLTPPGPSSQGSVVKADDANAGKTYALRRLAAKTSTSSSSVAPSNEQDRIIEIGQRSLPSLDRAPAPQNLYKRLTVRMLARISAFLPCHELLLRLPLVCKSWNKAPFPTTFDLPLSMAVRFTDDHFERALSQGKFVLVQHLDLSGSTISDLALFRLGRDNRSQCSQLRVLSLRHTAVTHVGLKQLRGMASLRVLNPPRMKMDAVSSKPLAGVTIVHYVDVRDLNARLIMRVCTFLHTDEVVRLQCLNKKWHQAPFPALFLPSASASKKITDHPIQIYLSQKKLVNVTALNLSHSQVTDHVLIRISRERLSITPSLCSLNVNHTNVTPEGLSRFPGMCIEVIADRLMMPK